MTSVELATLSFLRTALSNNDTSAVITMNADGTLSMSIDVGPGAQQLDMPALQGPRGASGQNQFPLMPMPDIYDSTSDLPAAAVLTNTVADIGKFWIIYQTDSAGDVTSVGAYIWFGTEFRFLPFGAQGPPGNYPVIKPFVTLLGPNKTSQLLTPTGSGTASDPYLATLDLSIPAGPPGPSAPLASFYDVAAWQPPIPGVTPDPPLEPPPNIGDQFTYTGETVTPPGFADPVPLWSPQQGVNGLLQPYVVPQSAFNSYVGITFARTATIAQFTVPPQPFPWKPIVFGQIRMFEAELSFNPFLMGIEVRLGNPQIVLPPPSDLMATVEPTGSLLFLPGTYDYSVTAVNSLGIILFGETTPSVEVTVTATSIFNSVALSWTAVDGAIGYNIYRGPSGGQASLLNLSLVTGTTFTDTAFPGSFTAPPSVNTAVATAGTLVARGFGNTGSGIVTVVPHTSSPTDPDTAMNPWNDVGLVAANHGGPDGTLYVNVVNDGLAAIWDYNASDAELFVMAAPATPQEDIQPIIPVVFSMKVTLSAQAPVTAHLPLAGQGVLVATVQEWPVIQEFRSTGIYTPPSWWISGTHFLDLIAVADGGGGTPAGNGQAGSPGASGSWVTTTIQTLSTGQLNVTIGLGGSGSNTIANGTSGTGVTIKDGSTSKLSATPGAGGVYAEGGSLSGTGWYGTTPGNETYLGQPYYGGVAATISGAAGGWPGGGGAGANQIFVDGGDGAGGAVWIVARKT